MRQNVTSFYERSQSAESASQANMDKFCDTNAPGITLNDTFRTVLEMNERVGQQLGNYRLTGLLGRGGFADVYLGEHIYLRTQAAIKVLSAEMATNEMEIFLTEARNL